MEAVFYIIFLVVSVVVVAFPFDLSNKISFLSEQLKQSDDNTVKESSGLVDEIAGSIRSMGYFLLILLVVNIIYLLHETNYIRW